MSIRLRFLRKERSRSSKLKTSYDRGDMCGFVKKTFSPFSYMSKFLMAYDEK